MVLLGAGAGLSVISDVEVPAVSCAGSADSEGTGVCAVCVVSAGTSLDVVGVASVGASGSGAG